MISRRGETRASGPAQHRRSGRTPSSCRSTGPGRPRQPAHQPRARPGVADAGVQGLRGAGGEGRRDRVGRRRATAWPAPGSSASCGAGTRDVTDHRARRRAGQPYNRILLSNVLAGKVDADDIAARRTRPGTPARVDARLRRRGHRDRPGGQAVITAGGEPCRTTPWCWPPAAGRRAAAARRCDAEGVVAFRTLDDCRAHPAARRRHRRAVVLGGGLLGLEAARGLAGRGPAGDGAAPGRAPDGPPARPRGRRGAGGDARRARASGRSSGRRRSPRARRTGIGDGVELADGDGRRRRPGRARLRGTARDRAGRGRGLAVDRGVVVDDRMRTGRPARLRDRRLRRSTTARSTGWSRPPGSRPRCSPTSLTGASRAATAVRGSVTRLKAAGHRAGRDGRDRAGDATTTPRWCSFADPARGTYASSSSGTTGWSARSCSATPPRSGTLTQLFDRGGAGAGGPAGAAVPRASAARTLAETPGAHAGRGDGLPVQQRHQGADPGLLGGRGARRAETSPRATRATTGCGGCRDAVDGIVGWLAAQDAG